MRVFRWIAARKAEHSVLTMCRVLGVSRSGFHAFDRRVPSDRDLTDAWLSERITQIHAKSRGTYGARRVHAELRHQGVRVGRKRVERLMRQAGVSGLVKRRRGRTTVRVPGVRTAPDLVERDFSPTAPDRLWVADITFIRTWQGWLYLAAVMDCFSRRIVGWSMADHLRSELVVDALEMAVAGRRPGPGLVHHSDQGSQGGFKRSSQRSIERGCDGQDGSGLGACGTAGDAVARASAGGEAGASSAVLGGDRAWTVERGRGGRGWCVGPGWRPVVSGGWRDADCHPGPAVGALPVVR